MVLDTFFPMTDRSVCRFVLLLTIFLTVTEALGVIGRRESDSESVQSLQQFNSSIEAKKERQIFEYKRNGMTLDIRIVPVVNDTLSEEDDDRFPMPPLKDLGRCVLDLSTICIKDRIARYIDTLSRLEKITLLGSSVKFVKVREFPTRIFSHRAMNPTGLIDRSIDEFFDRFALRITLPKFNKQHEQNQIDFMFDDNLVEGRGKGGGGKGGKGGGKCKQMMMCMMMALKMKMVGMMGLMAMKGMMMAGISMMMTKAMLLMKLMSLKGGGGGGGGHSGGGQLKEIVLLTKGSSGGGGGGGGHSSSGPSSSYGPPPSTGGGYDYSGGGGGGGGGWGRSFDNRLAMASYLDEYSLPAEQINSVSVINSYPDEKFNGNKSWDMWTNNNARQEHIGEVLQIQPVDELDKIVQAQGNNNINKKDKFDGKYDDTKIVYANHWKNYETADKIWDGKSRIVATKI